MQNYYLSTEDFMTSKIKFVINPRPIVLPIPSEPEELGTPWSWLLHPESCETQSEWNRKLQSLHSYARPSTKLLQIWQDFDWLGPVLWTTRFIECSWIVGEMSQVGHSAQVLCKTKSQMLQEKRVPFPGMLQPSQTYDVSAVSWVSLWAGCIKCATCFLAILMTIWICVCYLSAQFLHIYRCKTLEQINYWMLN